MRYKYNKVTIETMIGLGYNTDAQALLFPIGDTELLKPLPPGFFLRTPPQTIICEKNQTHDFNEEYINMRERFNEGQFTKAQNLLRNNPITTNVPYKIIQVRGDDNTPHLLIGAYSTKKITTNTELLTSAEKKEGKTGELNALQTYYLSRFLSITALESVYTQNIESIAIPIPVYITDKNSKEYKTDTELLAKAYAESIKHFVINYEQTLQNPLIIRLHLPYFAPTETSTSEDFLKPTYNTIEKIFRNK